MGGMLTRVARWFAVMKGVPSVAISSCEKAPPLCVTVIAACASRKVAALHCTVSNADGAVVGLRRRHLHGHTQRSALSVTVQVAGPGGGRGGVGE